MSDFESRQIHEQPGDAFQQLREAVMKAADPMPGRHIDAVFVMSVWVLDDAAAAPEGEARADILIQPTSRTGAVMSALSELIKDWEASQ